MGAFTSTHRGDSFEIKKVFQISEDTAKIGQEKFLKLCQIPTWRLTSGYFEAEVKKSPKGSLKEEFLNHPLSSISSRRIPGCKGKRLYLRAVNYLSKYIETLLF